MSKVQTLLKIISYQREHPEASNADVSLAVGVSERYLRECQKDVRALSFHLSKPLMKKDELDLLMSRLDGNVQNEQAILHKLQRAYLGTKDGIMKIASPRDKSSNGYLQIGIQTPLEDRKHLNFWLARLLYDPLVWMDQEGKMHYRLASECENVEGYSKWRVKLILNNTADISIPIRQNLDAIETALKAGGNKHYTIREFSDLTVSFQTMRPEVPLSEIEETISPVILKLIGDWLLEQTN